MAKQFKHQWHIFVDHLPEQDITQLEFANLLINFLVENRQFFDKEPFSDYGLNKYASLLSAENYPVEQTCTLQSMNSTKNLFKNYKLDKPSSIAQFLRDVIEEIFVLLRKNCCPVCESGWQMILKDLDDKKLIFQCITCSYSSVRTSDRKFFNIGIPTIEELKNDGFLA